MKNNTIMLIINVLILIAALLNITVNGKIETKVINVIFKKFGFKSRLFIYKLNILNYSLYKAVPKIYI